MFPMLRAAPMSAEVDYVGLTRNVAGRDREVVKPVPGFVGLYEVSSEGRVFSLHGGERRELKQRTDAYGYKTVGLSRGGVVKTRTVHGIVMLAFVGRRPQCMEVRHLSGKANENSLRNLKYGTHEENMKDTIRHGTVRRGENHGGAKLTEAKVREMWMLHESFGVSVRSLVKWFGVSKAVVYRILAGECWAHVTTSASAPRPVSPRPSPHLVA